MPVAQRRQAGAGVGIAAAAQFLACLLEEERVRARIGCCWEQVQGAVFLRRAGLGWAGGGFFTETKAGTWGKIRQAGNQVAPWELEFVDNAERELGRIGELGGSQ